jgi:microcystin-dependent protein
MSDAYVGEIRIFAGNYAPDGWAFCNGQQLDISQYSTLFNLIGTTYGGNGQTTFNLPDLQGRAVVHQGSNYVMGQQAGVENVTVALTQLPSHGHAFQATNTAGTTAAATPTGESIYNNSSTGVTALASQAVGSSGGSQPHANRQPYLGINYIISLFGIYPSQG